MKELAASMLNGTPPSAGLIEGLICAVTCFAIDDAMDKGIVVDMEPYWGKIGVKGNIFNKSNFERENKKGVN